MTSVWVLALSVNVASRLVGVACAHHVRVRILFIDKWSGALTLFTGVTADYQLIQPDDARPRRSYIMAANGCVGRPRAAWSEKLLSDHPFDIAVNPNSIHRTTSFSLLNCTYCPHCRRG